MNTPLPESAEHGRTYSATLVRSTRMTPEASPEDVRELRFRAADPAFRAAAGQLVRVLAPGQFGNRHHPRFYSMADVDYPQPDRAEFTLCVRRCYVIDDFNGERYAGVASNYLCDLPIGAAIEYTGPAGYPFAPPADPRANVLMIGMGTGIAPFRGLVRSIYERVPRQQGKVRLFYGAKSGLEMLYMNDENSALGIYNDQPTFRAFQAMSPRPALDAPVDIDKALESNAAEVVEMLQDTATHAYVAGSNEMMARIEIAFARMAGNKARWDGKRREMAAEGRWVEVLY